MKKIILIISIALLAASINAQTTLKTPCAMTDLNSNAQKAYYKSANAGGGYGTPAKITMSVQPIVTPVTIQKDSVTTETQYAVIYTDTNHVTHRTLLSGNINVKTISTGKLILSGYYGDSKKVAHLTRKWWQLWKK